MAKGLRMQPHASHHSRGHDKTGNMWCVPLTKHQEEGRGYLVIPREAPQRLLGIGLSLRLSCGEL